MVKEWKNVGRIQGDQGPKGDKGDKGEQGSKGDKGQDAIIEAGENPNGEYIRFENGVQICWGKATFENIEFNESIVPRSVDSYEHDFPKSFSNAPSINVDDTLGNTWCSTSAVDGDPNKFIVRFFSSTGNTAETITIDYMAIGRY